MSAPVLEDLGVDLDAGVACSARRRHPKRNPPATNRITMRTSCCASVDSVLLCGTCTRAAVAAWWRTVRLASERPCRHVAAMHAPDPEHLVPHLRRLICPGCARRAFRALAGTAEDGWCAPADGMPRPFLIPLGPAAVLVGRSAGGEGAVVVEDAPGRRAR